jgi:hypothetical protein
VERGTQFGDACIKLDARTVFSFAVLDTQTTCVTSGNVYLSTLLIAMLPPSPKPCRRSRSTEGTGCVFAGMGQGREAVRRERSSVQRLHYAMYYSTQQLPYAVILLGTTLTLAHTWLEWSVNTVLIFIAHASTTASCAMLLKPWCPCTSVTRSRSRTCREVEV